MSNTQQRVCACASHRRRVRRQDQPQRAGGVRRRARGDAPRHALPLHTTSEN